MLQELPIRIIGEGIFDFRNVKKGQHLSWPLDGTSWLSGIFPNFSRHHVLVSKVLTSDDSIEVINLSGVSEGDSEIRRECYNIRQKLRDRVVQRHYYEHQRPLEQEYTPLQPFDTDFSLKRAASWITKKGIHKQKYNVKRENCEHFVTFVRVGLAFSGQTVNFHVPG